MPKMTITELTAYQKILFAPKSQDKSWKQISIRRVSARSAHKRGSRNFFGWKLILRYLTPSPICWLRLSTVRLVCLTTKFNYRSGRIRHKSLSHNTNSWNAFSFNLNETRWFFLNPTFQRYKRIRQTITRKINQIPLNLILKNQEKRSSNKGGLSLL